MYAARKINGHWSIVRIGTGKIAGTYMSWQGALRAAVLRNRYGRHR